MVESLLARESFELRNRPNDPVRGDLRFADDGDSKKPAVIICHSFMAFKEWGFFPRVAEKLAGLGFASITFNFSNNGVRGDDSRITEFGRFSANTFSREIDDLAQVVDAVEAGRVGQGVIDHRTVVLLGHSRGGGVSIIHAAADTRIAALVTWSSVSTFDRWTDHQKKRWRESGFLPLSRDTTASPLRLGINLLNDLEQNAARLSVADAARNIRMPWLIVHGKADVTVPLREAEALYALARGSGAELLMLEGVGHLYNAATAAEDSYTTLDAITQLTADWLHNHIS